MSLTAPVNTHGSSKKHDFFHVLKTQANSEKNDKTIENWFHEVNYEDKWKFFNFLDYIFPEFHYF